MAKRVSVLSMAALLMVWGVSQRSVGAQQAWTGVISDSMCRADHGGGEVDPKEGTQKCVKNGEQYVLAVDQKIIPIANQDFGSLFENAGDTVKVIGELNGGAIVISKIERSR
jgi:hypothetical protein